MYKDIEQYLTDTIMNKPYGFSVKNEHFALYPVTIGKMYLTQRIIERLGIITTNIQNDASLEAIRLSKEKREDCLQIICYQTCKTKEEHFNNALISRRKALFDKELSVEDLAALMLIILTSDRTNEFFNYLGIDKEQERLGFVMSIKAKDNKSYLSFGGKSIFGSLIDVACERYGWTKDYVIWGIDYMSLRLMLADKEVSVYCTEEEMKKIPANIRNQKEDVINATKENMEKIKKMNWK